MPMNRTKIAVSCRFRTEGLIAALEREASALGLNPSVSLIAEGAAPPPDSILLLIPDLESLFPDFYYKLLPMHCSEIETRCNAVIEGIGTLVDPHTASGGRTVISTFPYPVRLGTGIFDHQNSEGQLAWTERLNARLLTFAESRREVYLFGLHHEMFLYGAERAYRNSASYYRGARFSPAFERRLGAALARLLAAMLRPRKKCLVLDLDNTLWGGVLGENGLRGIKLGDKGEGAVFRDLQREALQLADQGILLAVNSKNDEAAVREVFASHPGMVLKWDHFAAHRINWTDKASNLRAIAGELNIGLDSLVFADDSPHEIELVRRALPQVATVLLGGPPVSRLRIFRSMPYFDFLVFSEEDMRRKDHYAAERGRAAARTGCTTLEAYYRDLRMKAEISVSDPAAAPRVAQLTQKTNQFNLTTRRYSQGEISAAMNSSSRAVYSLRLSDRFGDSGIVGVAVILKGPDEWELEAFLLSCRVLGRTAEKAFLSVIQADCASAGAAYLCGDFIPTGRNGVAEPFYREAGFKLRNGRWSYRNASGPIPSPSWIEVSRPSSRRAG